MTERFGKPVDSRHDAVGVSVAFGTAAHHSQSDFWTDERLARMSEVDEKARAVARKLMGMTVESAAATVAEDPDLTINFIAPGAGIPAIAIIGRITAVVRDGVVVAVL